LQETSNETIAANCSEYSPWFVNLNIMCDLNPKSDSKLHVENFFIKKDSLKCTIDIFAIHRTGCGLLTKSAFKKFLDDRPVLTSLIMISFGFAACFFGGAFFDYILIGI